VSATPGTLPTDSRHWFVVYCKPHKEAFAQLHLERRGIEVFVPMLRLPEYLERRRRVVPLFPGYMFVNVDIEREFSTVAWAPGVSRFVSPKGSPAPIDRDVVAFLKSHADEAGVVTARPDLRVGQSVEITAGPFDGLIGIIQRPPNARGRVKVLMKLLNQQPVRVEVPVHLVRTAWVV
jgi:transcriptional antiterminator RfaH